MNVGFYDNVMLIDNIYYNGDGNKIYYVMVFVYNVELVVLGGLIIFGIVIF